MIGVIDFIKSGFMIWIFRIDELLENFDENELKLSTVFLVMYIFTLLSLVFLLFLDSYIFNIFNVFNSSQSFVEQIELIIYFLVLAGVSTLGYMLNGVWNHMWVKICGGRGGVALSIKLFALIAVPFWIITILSVFIFFVPNSYLQASLLGIYGSVYLFYFINTIVVFGIAHKMGFLRATLAGVLSTLFYVGIIVFILVAMGTFTGVSISSVM